MLDAKSDRRLHRLMAGNTAWAERGCSLAKGGHPERRVLTQYRAFSCSAQAGAALRLHGPSARRSMEVRISGAGNQNVCCRGFANSYAQERETHERRLRYGTAEAGCSASSCAIEPSSRWCWSDG